MSTPGRDGLAVDATAGTAAARRIIAVHDRLDPLSKRAEALCHAPFLATGKPDAEDIRRWYSPQAANCVDVVGIVGQNQASCADAARTAIDALLGTDADHAAKLRALLGPLQA